MKLTKTGMERNRLQNKQINNNKKYWLFLSPTSSNMLANDQFCFTHANGYFCWFVIYIVVFFEYPVNVVNWNIKILINVLDVI